MVNPSVWGSFAWGFLHPLFHYNKTNKCYQQMLQFLFYQELQRILPCKRCRDCFIENRADTLKRHGNTIPLNIHLFHIHNSVNKAHKKRVMTLAEYNRKYDNETLNMKNFYHFILILADAIDKKKTSVSREEFINFFITCIELIRLYYIEKKIKFNFEPCIDMLKTSNKLTTVLKTVCNPGRHL